LENNGWASQNGNRGRYFGEKTVLVKKMVILLMILGVGRWVHFVNKDGQQA
jgi:hypothetical protein